MKWFGQWAREVSSSALTDVANRYLHVGSTWALSECDQLLLAWTRTWADVPSYRRDALAAVVERKATQKVSIYGGSLFQTEDNQGGGKRQGTSAFLGLRVKF